MVEDTRKHAKSHKSEYRESVGEVWFFYIWFLDRIGKLLEKFAHSCAFEESKDLAMNQLNMASLKDSIKRKELKKR